MAHWPVARLAFRFDRAGLTGAIVADASS